MRPLVRDNAYEDLRAGRFARARRQLERVLAVTPGDPIAHTHVGHMHRLLAQRAREAAERAEHVRRALAAYDTAVALDATAPQPPRELGFLHYQEGDTARARAAFERYLALAPDAPDAGRIREYLVELGRGGRP
jgi:regulator of sirC expression with transglutaminase-like and TPR domain